MNQSPQLLNRPYKESQKLPYFFLSLFTLYFLQGALYPSGSIISQSILLLLLGWGAYCLLKEIFIKGKPLFVNLMVLFTLLLLFTFLISDKIVIGTLYEAKGVLSTFTQFRDETCFCLCLFIGIWIGKSITISYKTFLVFSIVLVLLCIQNFYMTTFNLIEESGKKSVTVNTAYQFVSLLPLFALTYKKYRFPTIILIFVSVFFIVLGSKRGALVCLFASFIYYLYWYNAFFKFSFKRIFTTIIIVITIIGFAFFQYQKNEYLQNRLEQTENKGFGNREIAYVILYEHWLDDPNIITQTFGNGTAQTVTFWGNYGHNDWLELLIDNGVIGVILYFSIFISCISLVKKRLKNPYYLLSGNLCLIIWFLRSIFSMGYTSCFSGLMTFLLGYIITRTNQTK